MVDKFAGVAVMRHACQADTSGLDGAVGHRPKKDASRRSLLAFGTTCMTSCWTYHPACGNDVISPWKQTAATAASKGYPYLSTPLAAVSMDHSGVSSRMRAKGNPTSPAVMM